MNRHRSIFIVAAVVLTCAFSGCSHSTAPATNTQSSASTVDTAHIPGTAPQIDTSKMPPQMVQAMKAAQHQRQ